MVQKGGLDRTYVLRLLRDALRVPYSEVVNTRRLKRLLARSEGGEHGPRPPCVWEGRDVDVLGGRMFSASLKLPPPPMTRECGRVGDCCDSASQVMAFVSIVYGR